MQARMVVVPLIGKVDKFSYPMEITKLITMFSKSTMRRIHLYVKSILSLEVGT